MDAQAWLIVSIVLGMAFLGATCVAIFWTKTYRTVDVPAEETVPAYQLIEFVHVISERLRLEGEGRFLADYGVDGNPKAPYHFMTADAIGNRRQLYGFDPESGGVCVLSGIIMPYERAMLDGIVDTYLPGYGLYDRKYERKDLVSLEEFSLKLTLKSDEGICTLKYLIDVHSSDPVRFIRREEVYPEGCPVVRSI